MISHDQEHSLAECHFIQIVIHGAESPRPGKRIGGSKNFTINTSRYPNPVREVNALQIIEIEARRMRFPIETIGGSEDVRRITHCDPFVLPKSDAVQSHIQDCSFGLSPGRAVSGS